MKAKQTSAPANRYIPVYGELLAWCRFGFFVFINLRIFLCKIHTENKKISWLCLQEMEWCSAFHIYDMKTDQNNFVLDNYLANWTKRKEKLFTFYHNNWYFDKQIPLMWQLLQFYSMVALSIIMLFTSKIIGNWGFK